MHLGSRHSEDASAFGYELFGLLVCPVRGVLGFRPSLDLIVLGWSVVNLYRFGFPEQFPEQSHVLSLWRRCLSGMARSVHSACRVCWLVSWVSSGRCGSPPPWKRTISINKRPTTVNHTDPSRALLTTSTASLFTTPHRIDVCGTRRVGQKATKSLVAFSMCRPTSY